MAVDTHKTIGIQKAIRAAGGVNALARLLGIEPSAVVRWRDIPAHRIIQIEQATGVPREELRPDLYRLRDKKER
jgi:DNA-binding transcriptional regulator YdaS (Cro superfamily)